MDQSKVIQRALDRDPAIKLTHAPRVTTLSGHRTQLVHELSDGIQVEIDCLPGVQENGYVDKVTGSPHARLMRMDKVTGSPHARLMRM